MGDPHGPWTSRAFGVDLSLSFEAPVFEATAPTANATPTTFDLVDADSILANWPDDEARRTGLMGPEEDPVMTVHEHATAGYLIRLPPYGLYLVSGNGMAVACAPPAVPAWDWQRLLIGQVLPAVATLRGYEVLHASAVAIGGHAIAFAGDPGAGKSSLAVQLMLRGAQLVAEDVVAISDDGGRLVVAPGAGLLNLREEEWGLVGAQALAGLGEVLGHSEGKVHALVGIEREPLPFGALFLLERDDGSRPAFERIERPTFADYFRNAFVVYVLRTQRMINQLHLAAALARDVPVVRLRVQPGVGARELAALVEAHVHELLAAERRS